MNLQIPAYSLLQRQISTFYVCVFDYVYVETMMIFLLTGVDNNSIRPNNSHKEEPWSLHSIIFIMDQVSLVTYLLLDKLPSSVCA